MSVRVKRGRPIIEVYDPRTAGKRYVTQAEIRALGFDPPTGVRQARTPATIKNNPWCCDGFSR